MHAARDTAIAHQFVDTQNITILDLSRSRTWLLSSKAVHVFPKSEFFLLIKVKLTQYRKCKDVDRCRVWIIFGPLVGANLYERWWLSEAFPIDKQTDPQTDQGHSFSTVLNVRVFSYTNNSAGVGLGVSLPRTVSTQGISCANGILAS